MANERFQNALSGKAQATPPIWMMRQAGRYHRHYQALRAKHSFMDLCKRPELAAEVALGPVEDFDFDLAILFSDLLFPLEAFGMGLEYGDKGPRLSYSLDEASFPKFASASDRAAIDFLRFQGEAVRRTRALLPATKSLIGFVGGPWTLFTYAVEGSHEAGKTGAKHRAKTAEGLYLRFRERLVPVLIENIRDQLEGGAEAVMILDTSAGLLAPREFSEWVAPAIAEMSRAFPGRLGYYTRGNHPAQSVSEILADPNLGGFGVDHRWDLAEVLARPGRRKFIQGNFDQELLFLAPKEFEARLRKYLEPIRSLDAERRAGWVCGVGHGLLPGTPEENVRSFVRIVREVFG